MKIWAFIDSRLLLLGVHGALERGLDLFRGQTKGEKASGTGGVRREVQTPGRKEKEESGKSLRWRRTLSCVLRSRRERSSRW